MLTIRLSRTGRKKLAMYRVVAADSKRAATGKFVALLGNYNPHTKVLVLDAEKVQKYLDSGAQPTSRVIKLLQTQKDVKIPAWALKNLKVKPIKAKEEETKEEPAKVQESEAEATEAAADEAPAEAEAEAKEPEEAVEVPAETAEAAEEPATE